MILFSMIVFLMLDYLLNFNLIECLPQSFLSAVAEIGLEKIGFCELLGIGIILQEGTSILENLHELGVLIPKVIANRIERICLGYLMKEVKKS